MSHGIVEGDPAAVARKKSKGLRGNIKVKAMGMVSGAVWGAWRGHRVGSREGIWEGKGRELQKAGYEDSIWLVPHLILCREAQQDGEEQGHAEHSHLHLPLALGSAG